MSAYSDAVLATTPVAYWRLGESAGTTAADSSGNGHDGTYTGGPLLGQPGLIVDPDTAALFDGVNDRVAVPYDAALALLGEMSAQAWIMPTAVATYMTVVGAEGAGRFNVSVTDSGAIRFVWNDGAYKTVQSAPGLVAAGGTYHVAFTRDASLFVRGYLNGVQVASGQGTAPLVDTVQVIIGATAVAIDFFSGTIDEVAAHNVALTADQVAAIYDLGANGPPPPHVPGATRPARRYHRLRPRVSR